MVPLIPNLFSHMSEGVENQFWVGYILFSDQFDRTLSERADFTIHSWLRVDME